MASRIIAVDPFHLVVFGGAGDLAYRKLLPALYQRHRDGQIPADGARIIGSSRRHMTDDAYRASTREALKKYVPAADLEDATVDSFLQLLSFIPTDAQSNEGWDQLVETLKDGDDRVRAFYLAVAPELIDPISERIGSHALV